MRTVIGMAALAGFGVGIGLSGSASADVYSLAPAYVGEWSDPNFFEMDGITPVGGSAELVITLDEGDVMDPNDDMVTLMLDLGGNPGGGPLPSFSATLPVNADGSISVMGLLFPDLDADAVFMTGGDFSPTPTLDIALTVSGDLTISAFDAAGFGLITATGQLTAESFEITADVFGDAGGTQLISSGGTVTGRPIPAPGAVAAFGLVGLGAVRRRR